MIAILTPRLRLRRARIDDLDSLHAVLSHPVAMRYWSTPPHGDRERTRQWLAAMIATSPGEGEDFVIEWRGKVIGKAGCFRFPEIGFILHPDYWGQGLAHEALAAVIERVFGTTSLPAIRADVDPRNQASLRLLERLGFRETGRGTHTWKIGEEWCHSVYLELRRPAPALPRE